MDAELRGVDPPSQWICEGHDRHDWNTFENYRYLHIWHIENHPFVDHGHPPPTFDQFDVDGRPIVTFIGDIYCLRSIILSVSKYLETDVMQNGRMRVKCFSYGYNARIAGKHNILRYDNQDDFDEYHKHVFDVCSGTQLSRVRLTRNEFPVLHEVLNEVMALANSAHL